MATTRFTLNIPSIGHQQTIEHKISTKQVIVFFIGGAGDKESYYGVPPSKIMKGVKNKFEEKIKLKGFETYYKGVYLGYNEVKGDDDIKNKVISQIQNKENTAIYIIGHSLGAWNGAHLSQKLTDKGYNVDLLITLDPVGKGIIVSLASDVYWSSPTPKANYWINIIAIPENSEVDDYIADFGKKWIPESGTQINDECKCHHRNANIMLNNPLKDKKISASDMLLHFINLYINKKNEN